MKYTFTAFGHKNILGTHRNTLEITKDKELSEKGDCIIAVGADFSLDKIKEFLKYKKLKLTINAGKGKKETKEKKEIKKIKEEIKDEIREEILFDVNKNFNSDHEIILRITDFASERTLGLRSDKSSLQLNRLLMQKLKNPAQEIEFILEPQIKAVIMDFDDTVEDFQTTKNYAHHKLGKILSKQFNIPEDDAVKYLYYVDGKYSKEGVGGNPKIFDRHLWFKDLFKHFKLDNTNDANNKKEVKEKTDKKISWLVDQYWQLINEKVKPMPFAAEVLEELKKKYYLIVMSDSDGDKKIKMKRIKISRLGKFFDEIITSDDTCLNKPNKRFYEHIFKKFNLKPEECVMMGDKPEVDLKLAKELGLKTVWTKYGDWAEHEGNKQFNYVDYEIIGFKNFFDDVDVL